MSAELMIVVGFVVLVAIIVLYIIGTKGDHEPLPLSEGQKKRLLRLTDIRSNLKWEEHDAQKKIKNYQEMLVPNSCMASYYEKKIEEQNERLKKCQFDLSKIELEWNALRGQNISYQRHEDDAQSLFMLCLSPLWLLIAGLVIYGLGCIWYYLCGGCFVFEGEVSFIDIILFFPLTILLFLYFLAIVISLFIRK